MMPNGINGVPGLCDRSKAVGFPYWEIGEEKHWTSNVKPEIIIKHFCILGYNMEKNSADKKREHPEEGVWKWNWKIE